MAEAFLEEIYKEANILSELKEVAEFAMYQDNHGAILKFCSILPDLKQLNMNYADWDVKKARELKDAIEKIKENVRGNMLVVGDIIERSLIPLIKDYIVLQGKISVKNDEGDYIFETTDSGFLTIKDTHKSEYFHSTSDPMWEAKKMAEYIFNPSKNEYAVWGCGLGYLVYQLYMVSQKSIKIHLFEPDARMVEYARKYGVLDWIPEENLNVVVDKDILPFLHCAEKENTALHIFKPELENVPEDAKQVIVNLYMEYVTGKKFKHNIEINFYRNIESNSKMISQFDYSKYSKEYVVVAAGPSLDESLEFLKNSEGKKTIVAVGTVFKKLIEKDIVPDMVVILDPQERTYKQIEGIEEQKVPMLISMSAYWKFAHAYQGERYLVPIPQINEIGAYAACKGETIWGCGGTVTSLGIEAAIKFGAKKIYLVGVDLAYPGGISHASNTMDRSTKDTDRMIGVEDVNGNMVPTEENFILYREWIENRIEQTPDIAYYNMSKIGAKIKGTKLWE